MKLLVLASTYPRWVNDHEPGFVHDLSKRLIEDFDVTVLCPHSPGAAVEEIMDGVTVVRYRYAPEKLELLVNNGGIVNNLIARPWLWFILPMFFVSQFWVLAKLNRKLRPDVIHAHWIVPQGLILGIMSLFGFQLPPYLLTSHGGDLFALKGRIFKRLKLFAVSKASAFTVVSEAMRQRAERLGVDGSKVRVRSMGVDLQNRFTAAPESLRHTREVLFVGRLVDKKGADILVQAVPRLQRAFPDVRVVIVGFGPEEKKLRSLAEKLEVASNIYFRGAKNQSEVATYYRQASVLAAPFVRASSGDEDGLGLVVAEALASGCPVVTSDLPATRDMVESLHGIISVPSGDVGALAEALVGVLDNSDCWEERVRKDREKLFQMLDWEFVAKDYSNFLRRLIDS